MMSKGDLRAWRGCQSDLHTKADRVNRETLWQMLRMYDVGGKLLSEIKICMLIV